MGESLIIDWNREWQSSSRAAYLEIQEAPDEMKPRVFDQHLGRWCDRLVDLQQKLINEHTQLALAYTRAIPGDRKDWVRDRVKEAWAPLTKGYRGWVICACDWAEESKVWAAPSWLSKVLPSVEFLPISADQEGRLTEEETAQVLAGILGFIEMRLLHAWKRDFDRAVVAITSDRSLLRKEHRHDITKSIIAEIKARNPGISQLEICGKLDSRGVRVLKSWEKYERTWSHALTHPVLKNRVKKYLSAIKPAGRRRR